MKEKKRCLRLPPCPPYDVEGMESWLGDMASRGWMLEKESFLLGFAAFERGDPAPVRYRLEASPRHAGYWDDNGGAPDPEAEELNADFGWEYVARRWQFYVYRSALPGPELHTDPRVQALAIRALEQRRTQKYLSIVLVLGINLFSVLLRGNSLLLAAVTAGLPLTLLTLLLTLWLLADGVREVVHLGKLKKRLAAGQPLAHERDWRRGQAAYFAGRLARLLLWLLWLFLLLRLWAGEAAGTGKIPLADYQGTLPFADMRSFAQGDFHLTMTDLLYSSVTDRSNAFVRRYVDLSEHASIRRPDGTTLNGGLYVTYFDARWEWLARALAGELLRTDRARVGRRWREPLEYPDLGLDEAVSYRSDFHFPCLVLRQGTRVLRAMFYQIGPDERLRPEEWAGILADSIR